MGAYSVAEAQQQLSRLVEEALMGEVVTITRDGQAVVTLTPSLQPPSAKMRNISRKCRSAPFPVPPA
jgi:antitoxin (DNA-binding transcriptional repressor) of toxin-antitoxin stability system